MDKELEQCLGLPEDEGISCAKSFIKKKSRGSCPIRFVLLTENDCEPCDRAHLKYGDDPDIKLVNITSKEGKDIIKKGKIKNVPALLIIDCDNNVIV